jgi:hypothetical protein
MAVGLAGVDASSPANYPRMICHIAVLSCQLWVIEHEPHQVRQPANGRCICKRRRPQPGPVTQLRSLPSTRDVVSCGNRLSRGAGRRRRELAAHRLRHCARRVWSDAGQLLLDADLSFLIVIVPLCDFA